MIIQEDVPYTKEEVKATVKTIHDLRKQLKQPGWHPGSEHPVLEEDGTVVVISIHKDPKCMTHVGRAQCSKMGDKYYWDERNEWWCYPPKEE